jgi:hypothetical protein
MKNILNALSRLTSLTGDKPSLESRAGPTYREIIAGYLESLETDSDTLPETDRDSQSFRRRAMTANFSR